MRHLTLTAGLAVVLVSAGPAAAQGRLWAGGGVGVGVGPGWNYYNLPNGPYTYTYVGPGYGWGWFPGAYGSFWTNGLSLYGPPVPTMGVTPGSFGGSDAHKGYYSTPPRLYGTGWFGYRSPSPRPADPTVSVYPPPATYTGPGYDTVAPRERVPGGPAGGPASVNSLRLCVRVPANAQVWIDGRPTEATGRERWFESPPLATGDYQYQVTAKWGDGQIDTKTVAGRPGDTLTLDFAATATAKGK
jgi:uncharacterized protein (TIGR03000 family)